MTDIHDDQDPSGPPGDDDPLAASRQQVRDLQNELTQTLWELGYFVTMTCALGHLGQSECDCDDRIRRVNDRLQVIKFEHTYEDLQAQRS